MDADDISLKNRIAKQVKYMETHPEIDICGSYACTFGASSTVLKYPLENRDVYYKCESIVDQHGKVWFNDDYQNMVKVYTLWICPHPNKEDANTIREISLAQKQLYGNPS